MWNILLGFLFARATGTGRLIRLLLILTLLGAIVAGVVYAFVVFRAVQERSNGSQVHAHSTH